MTGRFWPVVALVAITPVVVDPGGFHRYVALRFAFVAVVLTVAFAMLLRDGAVKVDRRIVALLVAAVVVAALSALSGPDPLLGLLGDPVRMMGVAAPVLVLVAFIVGARSGSTSDVTTALLAGGAAVIVVGLGQLAGLGGHAGRVTSTMGNAGFLGAFLCLVVPIAIGRAIAAETTRLLFGALAVGGLVVLVATETRGAWIGAMVGVALLAALRVRRVALAMAAVVVVGVLAAAPFAARDTARGRVDTWRESADVVARRPLLGWGPEGFRRGFGEEMSPEWVRRYSLDQIPDRAHNRFIDIAASTGVAGLMVDGAILAAIVMSMRRVLRSLEPASAEWWGVAGIAAGLAAWLVQGQFLFDTFDLAVIVAVLAGAAIGRGDFGVRRPHVVPALALLALIVVFAGLNLAADRLVADGSGQQPANAFDHLRRADALRPRALDVNLLAAEVALRSGDRDLLEEAHALLRTWDDDLVRVADARVLAALGDVSGAETLLRAVLNRQPANTRARDALDAVVAGAS